MSLSEPFKSIKAHTSIYVKLSLVNTIKTNSNKPMHSNLTSTNHRITTTALKFDFNKSQDNNFKYGLMIDIRQLVVLCLL